MRTCNKCGIEKLLEEFAFRYETKTYRNECLNCFKQYKSKWYRKNAVKAKLRRRELYLKNIVKIQSQNREYKKMFADKVKAKNLEYYQNNFVEIAEKKSSYKKLRRQTDPVFRLIGACYIRLREALRGNDKADRTFDLIGCSSDQLRMHIQSQFKQGMCWNNYGRGEGRWHVDHIIPCKVFDMSDPEEQRMCFHYSNLQPLWEKDNLRKHAKWE